MALLDRSGLSERELARRAGLGHATVNHLVTGRRKFCTQRTAGAIVAGLQLRPELRGWLFSPVGEREEQLR